MGNGLNLYIPTTNVHPFIHSHAFISNTVATAAMPLDHHQQARQVKCFVQRHKDEMDGMTTDGNPPQLLKNPKSCWSTNMNDIPKDQGWEPL